MNRYTVKVSKGKEEKTVFVVAKSSSSAQTIAAGAYNLDVKFVQVFGVEPSKE